MYVIITERLKGSYACMFFRAAIAGQNARSEWVLTKEAATQYEYYHEAVDAIKWCATWTAHNSRQAFGYPRVVNAADIQDDKASGANQGCGKGST
jgi:hypothetical protein